VRAFASPNRRTDSLGNQKVLKKMDNKVAWGVLGVSDLAVKKGHSRNAAR
jgi:hypothetical protein